MANAKKNEEENKIIRTPTKLAGGITEEEKVQLKAHTDAWIKNAFRCDHIDPKKIIPAIEGMYECANLAKPVVAIAPSPLVMAFAYGACSALFEKEAAAPTKKPSSNKKALKNDDAKDAPDNGTKAHANVVTDAVTSASASDSRIGIKANKFGTASYDAVVKVVTDVMGYTPVITKAHRSAKDTNEQQAYNACKDIGGDLAIEHAKKWYDNYQGGNMWSYYDCYLTAFRDVLGLRLPIYEKYKYWETAAREGGFRVMHEKFCIVSDFPEFIKIDDTNRPHGEDGPSHRWRDGWSLYYWHGVKIPAEWIEDKENLLPQTALTWANMEQRRAACEIIGWNKILTQLNATIIDEDGDPEIGQLLEVDIPEIGREKFLKVLCGTLREFALPVPPTMKTALEAQAWTWDLDTKTFTKPEVRT